MGSPWNWVSMQGVTKASMMGLPGGRKSFKIGLVVYTQYRLWQTASQPRFRSNYRAYYIYIYVARVKSAYRRRKLLAGCSKAEPKIFAPPQDTLPGGAGWPKFNRLEMVTTFTYRPSLVKIDARKFKLSW